MAAFPTTVATDSDLYIAVNATSTQLTDNPLTAGATTANVVSTTGFPTVGFISIDSEIIKYTGKTGTSFTGLTRGADGTTAASHVQNSQVFHNVIAIHHNALKDDLIATEQFISDLIGRVSTQVKAPDGTVSLPGYSFAADTDTGLFRPASNQLSIVLGGMNAYNFNVSSIQLNGTTRIDNVDGTAANPSYTFGTDTDTGIFRGAANQIGFSTNGIGRFSILNTQINASVPYIAQFGSAATPSFAFDGDEDTGLFRVAADQLAIATAGVERTRFTSVGLRTPDGAVTDPAYSFQNDSTMGMYRISANTLGFTINSVLRVVIDSAALTVKTSIINQNGSASVPSYTFEADTDTGLFHQAANKLAVALGGVEAVRFDTTGTADDNQYTPIQMFGGGGTSGLCENIIYSTTAITTAKTILNVDNDGGLFIVYGTDGASNDFIDLILCSFYNQTPTVITSKTARGTPAARTYSMTGNNAVQLAMASGTYSTRAWGFAIALR